MTELIDTTEMYLRIIFELEEEGTPALRARIVDRLGHSGPTVSQTVARMERDGLLTVQPDRSLALSTEGRARATRVMRKHRLAERLLADVIGLEYEHVHAEACRWEHVMSDRVERKILELLQGRRESPYGNPIPGLAELGLGEGEHIRTAVVPLAEVGAIEDGRVEIRRFGEALQDDAQTLGLLQGAGLVPGCRALVSRDDDRWIIAPEGGTGVSLPPTVAALVWVSIPQRPLHQVDSATRDQAG